MNNLKFRAWNPETKEMLSDLGLIIDGGFVVQSLFTGVKDSHGAELYTGDLVDVEGSGICEVAMCKFYGVVLVDSGGNATPIIDQWECNDKITLVGNKWQNPELIKQEA